MARIVSNFKKTYPWRHAPPKFESIPSVSTGPATATDTTVEDIPTAVGAEGDTYLANDPGYPGPTLVYSDGQNWLRSDTSQPLRSKAQQGNWSYDLNGSGYMIANGFPDWVRRRYDYNDAFAVEIVFQPNAASNGSLVSWFNISIKGWEIEYLSSGNIRFRMITTSTSNDLLVDTTDTPCSTLNQWYHVVVTYDGSTNASGVNIIVDDNDETLNTVYDTLSSSFWDTSRTFSIGTREVWGNRFNGLVHRMRMWSTRTGSKLTAAEAGATRGGGPAPAHLDAYIRCYNGLIDHEGNSRAAGNYAGAGLMGEWATSDDYSSLVMICSNMATPVNDVPDF